MASTRRIYSLMFWLFDSMKALSPYKYGGGREEEPAKARLDGLLLCRTRLEFVGRVKFETSTSNRGRTYG